MTIEDYKKIILNGYLNQLTKNNLKDYFYREIKKAEKEYYTIKEFIEGCQKALKEWEEGIKYNTWVEKHNILKVIETIKEGKLKHCNTENEKQEKINKYKKELKEINKYSFPLRITHSIGISSHFHSITMYDIDNIKTALLEIQNTVGINESPQQIVKQKPEQETPKTFDELFYNTDLVKPCIDILKELDPPLIDTDYNFIGKLKGVFCVWIDEMQRQGIVKSNYRQERKLFASLIPQKIKRFSIDESMFGKHQSKAENLYRTDIKTKVSKIKLSQNSH